GSWLFRGLANAGSRRFSETDSWTKGLTLLCQIRVSRPPGDGAASGLRRDAASPLRQCEKCAAGVPIGGGTVSTMAFESPGQTLDSRQAFGKPEPEPPS